MSRPIISIFLIIIAIITFFAFIDPTYEEIKVLQAESQEFDDALVKARELQSIRDELLSRYNTFSAEELDRIEKLLPDNVDNVRLILDLDTIASSHGMVIRNVSLNEETVNTGEAVQVGGGIGEISISFNVTSSYQEFKDFTGDLERSLRIMDIQRLSLSPRVTEADLIDFDITIKTYWLK